MAVNEAKPGRRQFVASCMGMAGSAGVLGLLLGTCSEHSKARPAWAIRPPGALAEDDFAAACVRCGLGVRACPFDTLKLAELGDGVTAGTPYFVARQVPCEMCKDIPCVEACPTGALSKNLTDIRKAEMGVAVLISRDTCMRWRAVPTAAPAISPVRSGTRRSAWSGDRPMDAATSSRPCIGTKAPAAANARKRA